MLAQLAAQCFFGRTPLADVAQEADEVAGIGPLRGGDRQLDRYLPAVLAQRRHLDPPI